MDRLDELVRLWELKEKGALTDDEFAVEKRKLLDHAQDAEKNDKSEPEENLRDTVAEKAVTGTNTANSDSRRLVGAVALTVGIIGFVASFGVGGGGSFSGSMVAGLLNPLFFIGVPLGCYWLNLFANGRPNRLWVDRSGKSIVRGKYRMYTADRKVCIKRLEDGGIVFVPFDESLRCVPRLFAVQCVTALV